MERSVCTDETIVDDLKHARSWTLAPNTMLGAANRMQSIDWRVLNLAIALFVMQEKIIQWNYVFMGFLSFDISEIVCGLFDWPTVMKRLGTGLVCWYVKTEKEESKKMGIFSFGFQRLSTTHNLALNWRVETCYPKTTNLTNKFKIKHYFV
jgi:hypothetical protein